MRKHKRRFVVAFAEEQAEQQQRRQRARDDRSGRADRLARGDVAAPVTEQRLATERQSPAGCKDTKRGQSRVLRGPAAPPRPAPPARVPCPEVRQKIQACVPSRAAPGVRGTWGRTRAAAAATRSPCGWRRARPRKRAARRRAPGPARRAQAFLERPSDTRLTAVLTATAARS